MAGKVTRAIFRPKAKTPGPRAVKLSATHAHRCKGVCEGRYEDRCDNPWQDEVCPPCRNGYAWSLWRVNSLPAPCCPRHSRLATADERADHSLAGESTWWICVQCKRTHPFDPIEGEAP